MLRPLFKTSAVAIGAFVALTTWFSAPAKAIVIVEASVDGGAFQEVASAPTDSIVNLNGPLPGNSGSFIATLTNITNYPVLQLLTGFQPTISNLVVRATVTDLDRPAQVERLLTGYADAVPIGAAEVFVDAFIDPNNAAFGTTIPVAGGGPITGALSTDILTQLATPVAPLYSLTLVNTLNNITGTVPGNFTSTLQVVPEPGTLGLLGAGLMVAGLMMKRRRRQA